MASKKPVQDKEKKPSFWTTLPGVLTAVAAMLTAIAGLITAVDKLAPGPTQAVTEPTRAPSPAYTVTPHEPTREPDPTSTQTSTLSPSPTLTHLPTDTPTLTLTPTPVPVVILMDSTLQMLVYDPETYRYGGTNADDITRILRALPVPLEIRKENTSLHWDREEEVLLQRPDLIIIHASCFYDQTNPMDSDAKLSSFLEYLRETSTKFLIYSRGSSFMDDVETRQYFEQNYPFLAGRVETMWVNPEDRWNEITGRRLRCKVKAMLNIPPMCE